jgi:hypothetical protein
METTKTFYKNAGLRTEIRTWDLPSMKHEC